MADTVISGAGPPEQREGRYSSWTSFRRPQEASAGGVRLGSPCGLPMLGTWASTADVARTRPRGGPRHSTARRQLTPEATAHLHRTPVPPSPPPPRHCTVPQAGERTDQRQTVRPRGPQGVEGVARPPQVGGTRGCTPGRPPPSAGMQRQGEGAGYPHPLIRPSRPTSARLGLGGGGGGKLGHRSLPQAPACEANAGWDPTALEAEREAGASDPADSAGTATCPPAGPRLPDASSPDQRGGLPGGTSRGQSHGHSAHKGPLAERLGQSGIRPWSLARPAEAPTSVRTKGLVQDSSRLSRERARFRGPRP